MAAIPMHAAAAAVLVAGLFVPPGKALAAESSYTTLDLDACAVLSEQDEGESIEQKCSGFRGVPVFFSEGDLRTDVDFGASDGTFSTFGPFNNITGTVEWRRAGGRPFAAIVRYEISADSDEPGKRSNVLLVAKVGRPGAPGCPMAVIDVASTEQANGVARGVAALAPHFDCSADKPIVLGSPDGPAASFTGAVPEGQ